jgi:hypothetical protein
MPNKYIVAIVPQDKKDAANIDCDKVNKGKTLKTFTVGLSPDGKPPITHHWCCWWMDDKEEKQIRKDFDPSDPTNPTNKNSSKIYILDKVWTAEKILEDNHLKRIEADISKDEKKDPKSVK